jgi:hypothetical protein
LQPKWLWIVLFCWNLLRNKRTSLEVFVGLFTFPPTNHKLLSNWWLHKWFLNAFVFLNQ